MTLTQLRSFLAVVRGGSVTAAADELVVTQPSVSAALAALAREVGTPLMIRDGRGVRMSPAGVAFAPYAGDVIGLLEEGRQAALQAAAVASKRLRLAVVTTAAESFVPPLMRSFATQHEDTALTVQVANRDTVVAMVLEHDADVAITGRPPSDERIVATAMGANDFVLVTAADDPLVAAGAVGPEELADRTWLLREPGSGTRSLNEQFLARTGIRPQTLTLGSNGAIKQAARAGLGVAILSRDAVGVELDAGVLATIEADALPSPGRWYLLRSAIGPARPAAEAFVAYAAGARAPQERR